MPKWGLTEKQRESKPWGISDELLLPAKTITDPVHGDIYLTRLESLLVDSPPLQRLRRVRQLGTTHLVYPGATHSRFSHVLGATRAAQDLLDAVADNQAGPHHTPGLLDEWVAADCFDEEFAQATVLARLGALLHDLCHIPLGHTIEDDLKVLDPHDKNAERFGRLWSALDPRARRTIEEADDDLAGELRMLILSKEGRDPATESRYPFVADIVGNTICADLVDYLRRDHTMTGLPLALGYRFASAFYVRSSTARRYPKRMVIQLMRAGHLRTDIVTELVKYLRYRYELTERVLTHHTKTSADAMIGKLLEMWRDDEWVSIAAAEFPAETAEVGRHDIDLLRERISTSVAERASSRRRASRLAPGPEDIDDLARRRLEDEFLRRSDDGLLEDLRLRYDDDTADKRRCAVADLAARVQDRRLFKLIGRAESRADKAHAPETWRRFGKSPQVRRELERAAAKRAGLEHGWQVVIWLPAPEMKLKVAKVLVDNGESVLPLHEVFRAAKDIVDQHRDLWSIAVYADASLRPSSVDGPTSTRNADILLGYLKEEMDIGLLRWDGVPVRTLRDLAVHTVAEHCPLPERDREQLASVDVAALGGDWTFDDLLTRTWEAAVALGFTDMPRPADL